MMDAIGNTLQGTTAIRGASQQSVTQTAQPEADTLAGPSTNPHATTALSCASTARRNARFCNSVMVPTVRCWSSIHPRSNLKLTGARPPPSGRRNRKKRKRGSPGTRTPRRRRPDRHWTDRYRPDRNRTAGGFADSGPVHRTRPGRRAPHRQLSPCSVAADLHPGIDTARRCIGTRVHRAGHRRHGPARSFSRSPLSDLRLERLKPSDRLRHGCGHIHPHGCDPSAT